jgi:gliding motility-associated-like protein
MTDSVNVTCFGDNDGSATAAVADGTPPYTYAWNTAPVQTSLMATGLFAGSYCILVTDASSCVSSVCVSLSEPTQLVAVASGTPPSCNGGTDGLVSAAVTGGIGPYTYAWTGTGGCNTASCGLLGDGTYNLTVTDANGCVATSSVTLVEPATLAMLITGVDVSCGGLCDGSANVIAAGGTTPYTYAWSNGDIGQIADSLCAAIVTLSITDANGCLASSSVVISEPTTVVVTIPSYGDIDCFGNCNGFAQSGVSGGVSPYTYSWNTSSINDQVVGLCSGIYAVTVEDNNGCTDTTSVTISEPPAVTLSLTSQAISCYGYCDGAATVTATGGVAPYLYLWDDNNFQTTMTATGLCVGAYSVVVTDSKGCSSTTTVAFTEPQAISVTAVPVASTCGYQNGSACVVVTGGVLPYTIQWNDPDQTIGTCIDSVYAAVYSVCLTDGNGCSVCTTVTVNDITGPVVDSVAVVDLKCFGDANGSATVYPSGGTPPYTYFWQDFVGDTIGTNSNILFGLSGGTYSIALRDVNGCLYAQSFTITEPLQIASAITSSADALCFGDCNGSATVAVGNGTIPYTYSWQPSGGNTANATGLCAGMNNVLITDANGCQTNNGTLINEPTELQASTASANISCYGGSDGEITVTATGGGIPYSYQWLPGGTGTGITVSNLGAGTYTVIVTDINGCDTNQTVSIIDPPLLTVTGGSTPSSCGDPNGQAYVSANGGTTPYTYIWFDGGGIPIGQTTDTAIGLVQGSYECLIEDVNGCSFILPVSVNDNAGPAVTYESSTDVLCFGTATGEASVSVIGNPPYTYLWEDGQQTKIATGLVSGTYTVTVTDVNGCTDSVDVTITEPPEITLVISGATIICEGDQTQLSVSASGGVPPYSYDWDNAGYTSSSTLDVSPSDTTTYVVNVQDANGCIVSKSVEVQVYPPLVVVLSDPFICEGDDLTLTASGSGGMEVPANYVYTWLDAGKNIVFTGNPYVVQGLTSGVYTYYVVLSDACPGDTTMITATVSPEPPAPVVGADAVYCFGDPMVDLTAQGQNISWYTDAALTPPPMDTGPDYTPSGAIGTTTYYATQTVDGCESPPGTATIVVNPLPTAGFYPFPEEAPITNPGIVFTDNASLDVVSWVWSFGDGDSATGNMTNFFNGDTVVHIYSDSGTFVVYQIVTNSFGCIDIAVDTVEITNEYILFAPLAFTPGGDNINDYFLPLGTGISDEKFRFYVFDRWGDLIYQHDGAYAEWLGWDGRANDGKEQAQQDVYVWLIRTEDLDENAHEYVGHVTLLR